MPSPEFVPVNATVLRYIFCVAMLFVSPQDTDPA